MKKYAVVLLSSALLFFLFTGLIFSQEDKNYRNEKTVAVPEGEVIDGDFFAFGDSVEISGTVNGDVYTVAGNVLVDGEVNGDLLAAGGTVSISGNIAHDVRVAGAQVTISGKIGRNLSVVAGNVELIEGADIGGSIVAGAGNISLAAPVGKNIRVGAGNLTISNKINGDVFAGVESIRLTSKAAVTGDLTYWSESDASIDENANIGGEVTKNAPTEVSTPSSNKVFGIFAGFNLFAAFVGLVSTFVIGIILVHFLPNVNRKVVHTLKNKPWPSLGFGILTLILAPIIIGLLFITVIGLPIALIVSALYLISLYVVRIFVIFWIGTTIFERSGRKVHEIGALAVGLSVYYIISLIPIVGGIITFLTLVFGLGAALLTKKELYLAARKKDLI